MDEIYHIVKSYSFLMGIYSELLSVYYLFLGNLTKLFELKKLYITTQTEALSGIVSKGLGNCDFELFRGRPNIPAIVRKNLKCLSGVPLPRQRIELNICRVEFSCVKYLPILVS